MRRITAAVGALPILSRWQQTVSAKLRSGLSIGRGWQSASGGVAPPHHYTRSHPEKKGLS